jgi:hydrogenase nickel incorporation protein HypB
MCTVCGCSEGEVTVEGHDHEHSHHHDHDHAHTHAHDHAHAHDDVQHYGHGPAGPTRPVMSQARMVEIEENILSKNNQYASANRQWLRDRRHPGAEPRVLARFGQDDAAHAHDRAILRELPYRRDRGRPADVQRRRAHPRDRRPAIQVNTGKGCHLDGHMVGHAIETLAPDDEQPSVHRERRQPGLPRGI